MLRIVSLLVMMSLGLAACAVPDSSSTAGSGAPKVYKIKGADESKIQYRMLDSVNALRTAAGLGQVQLNAQLNAAAATHSRDMSKQNRPWHFGSDGSSPIDRVARSGYQGRMMGENISETYETELETLAAWMDEPGTRDVILDPKSVNMGFAWYQEKSGKLWWTLLMGS